MGCPFSEGGVWLKGTERDIGEEGSKMSILCRTSLMTPLWLWFRKLQHLQKSRLCRYWYCWYKLNKLWYWFTKSWHQFCKSWHGFYKLWHIKFWHSKCKNQRTIQKITQLHTWPLCASTNSINMHYAKH